MTIDPFPPARPGSVGDNDYSPLVLANNGVIYDAPIVAAAVDEATINFQLPSRTSELRARP
jgi:hypothetical protein